MREFENRMHALRHSVQRILRSGVLIVRPPIQKNAKASRIDIEDSREIDDHVLQSRIA